MSALRKPEWLRKVLERRSEEVTPAAPPPPQRIPTFEELAEVLPNLNRTLR